MKGWLQVGQRQVLEPYSSIGAVAPPFTPRYIFYVRSEARFVAEFTDRPEVG